MKITIDLDKLVAHLVESYPISKDEWYGSERGMAASVFYDFFTEVKKTDAAKCMAQIIEDAFEAERTTFREEHTDFSKSVSFSE